MEMAREVTYACDRCGAPATERRVVTKSTLPATHPPQAYDLKLLDLCDACAREFDETTNRREAGDVRA